jgi:hypothetical protein
MRRLNSGARLNSPGLQSSRERMPQELAYLIQCRWVERSDSGGLIRSNACWSRASSDQPCVVAGARWLSCATAGALVTLAAIIVGSQLAAHCRGELSPAVVGTSSICRGIPPPRDCPVPVDVAAVNQLAPDIIVRSSRTRQSSRG